MTEPMPFRVGVVGISPQGRFLVERLSIQLGSQLVMFQPEETPAQGLAQALEIPCTTDWHRFLSDPELKAVLFLDGASLELAQVQQTLQQGLPVGVLPPLARSVDDLPKLAEFNQERLFMLPCHAEDADFCAARSAVQSDELGPLRAVKRLSWVAALVHSQRDDWFAQHMWADVDHLLSLVGERPESVYAADFSAERESYFIVLHFLSGLVAHLERRRDSLVPVDLGWTLCGERGGYAGGRRFIQTEAGEIYDIPIEAEPPENIMAQLRRIVEGADDNSWQQALEVLEIQTAVQQSAATGQVVRLAAE